MKILTVTELIEIYGVMIILKKLSRVFFYFGKFRIFLWTEKSSVASTYFSSSFNFYLFLSFFFYYFFLFCLFHMFDFFHLTLFFLLPFIYFFSFPSILFHLSHYLVITSTHSPTSLSSTLVPEHLYGSTIKKYRRIYFVRS